MMPYKSRIPEIIAKLEPSLATAVNRAGFRMEAEAKKRARVDTGYMRGQIRWRYGETAVGFTGDDKEPLSWAPSLPLSGEIAGGAGYTVHNEFGTINMSAQPMFVPAAEVVRPLFIAEVVSAVRKAVD